MANNRNGKKLKQAYNEYILIRFLAGLDFDPP